MPEVVYLIGPDESSLVKIGHSNEVERRLGDIQRMSPATLRIRWRTDGGHGLESALHRRFQHLRKHGEWFDFGELDPVAQVVAAVEKIRAEASERYQILDAEACEPELADPVGLAEIATRLRVQRDTVDKWRTTDGWPDWLTEYVAATAFEEHVTETAALDRAMLDEVNRRLAQHTEAGA